jgi:hypothetical protein
MPDYSKLSNKTTERALNREAIEAFKDYILGMGNDKSLSIFDTQTDGLRQSLMSSDINLPINEEVISLINEGLLASDGASWFAKDIANLKAFQFEVAEGSNNDEDVKHIDDLKQHINLLFGSTNNLNKLGMEVAIGTVLQYPNASIAKDQFTATKDSGKTDSEGVIKEKKGYQLAEFPDQINASDFDVKVSVNTSNLPDSIDNPSLAAFEIPSGRFSLPTRNSDALSLFFNAIPTVEMSKCVPYLNITVVTGKGDNVKLEKLLSLGETQENEVVLPSTIERQIESSFLGSDISKDFDMSTMGAFLGPQTLVNTDIRKTLGQEILEPIAPLLSINSFDVSISGLGVGLFSSKRGTIKLTLHDRSKLNFIAPLISVEQFGKTRFVIDYGWSHPEGSFGSSNTVAKFLNSLRDGGVFNLISSNMTIKNSSVDITLEVAMSGEQDSFNTLISCGYLVQSSVFRPQIEQAIIDQIPKTQEDWLGVSGFSMPDVRTTVSQTTSQVAKPGNTIPWDSFKEIMQSSGQDQIANIASALKVDEAVLNTVYDYAIKDDEDESEFSISSSNQTLLQHMSLKIAGLRVGNDPYLSDVANKYSAINLLSSLTPTGMDDVIELSTFTNKFTSNDESGFRNYASLGRIISMFIGYPLSTLGRYDEVQLFFYPMNDFSAGAHIYTTASFPINISKLKEVIDEAVFDNPNITITRFFALIEKNFTNNPFYEMFLLSDELKNMQSAKNASVDKLADKFKKANDDTTSEEDKQKLTEDFKTIIAALNIDENDSLIEKIKSGTKLSSEELDRFKESRKEAINQLRKEKKDVLNKIYTNSPKYSGSSKLIEPKFVKPNISLYYESLQAIVKKEDDTFHNDPSKRILRVHVYDEESSPHIEELQMIDLITRNKLNSGRSLVDVENIDVGPDGNITGGNVSMGSISIQDVKQIIKSRIPNVTYGSQMSPIESFSLNSNTSGNVSQALLITSMLNKKSPQTGHDSQDSFGEVKVVPTTATMNCLGCPIIQRGGQFYIDMKTNTTADNVYAVQSVSHSISRGKFNTSLNLTYVAQSSSESLSKKIENVLIEYAPELSNSDKDI